MDQGLSLTLPQIIRLGEVALATLSRLGVRLPSENRLSRSLRVVRRHHAAGPPSLMSEVRELVSAEQNLLEAFYIANAAEESPAPLLILKLDAMLRGQLDHSDDSLSHVRDTQFELFVWALLRLSGEGLVEIAEPDIVVTARGGTIGVAAKRMSSPRSLRRHVKKAADQIDSAGAIIGVLAVNVDAILPPELEAAREFVADFAARVESELDRQRPGHLVAAVLVVGTSYARSTSGFPQLSYDISTRVIRVHREDQERVHLAVATLGHRIRLAVDARIAAQLADDGAASELGGRQRL